MTRVFLGKDPTKAKWKKYVDVPGYSALILRRTWPDLNSPGAILDRARSWLGPTDAKSKDGGRIIEFPSGATIQFGYLQHDKDKYKFASAEYQCGVDFITGVQRIHGASAELQKRGQHDVPA